MKILIVRTDRIGDVVLSTPTIQALRKWFPKAHLACLVRPETAPLVEGNPYLNEVIVYDRHGAHRGWLASWRFARALRAERFDVALILHPTVRNHMITWLAGIPRRIGYGAKWPWLLTEPLPDRRAAGVQHELEYALDVAKAYVGKNGETCCPSLPCVPVRLDEELTVDAWLKEAGWDGRPLVALHPGASCPSKRWPEERFAELADRLAQQHQVRPVILTGPDERERGFGVIQRMRTPALEACGRLALGEVAALLKRARVLISNDSGPVHLATAVGTPVIAVFGRNQEGLSPTRWRPVGRHDRVLHRDVGCEVCLAHRCQLDFLCLKMISVEEVFEAASQMLEATSEVVK